MARTVVTPDGDTWKVGRRWLPFRPRHDRFDVVESVDAGSVAEGDDPLSFLLLFILSVVLWVVLTLVFAVVVAVIALVVEAVVAALVLVVAAAGRVVLRRPWTVVARCVKGLPRRHTWAIVGWRASGKMVDDVARSLAEGTALPPAIGS